jgi:hypothetical protein
MTEIRRIQMSAVQNLEQAIKDECDIMYAVDFLLVSSFVYGTHLVLIFQSKPGV